MRNIKGPHDDWMGFHIGCPIFGATYYMQLFVMWILTPLTLRSRFIFFRKLQSKNTRKCKSSFLHFYQINAPRQTCFYDQNNFTSWRCVSLWDYFSVRKMFRLNVNVGIKVKYIFRSGTSVLGPYVTVLFYYVPHLIVNTKFTPCLNFLLLQTLQPIWFDLRPAPKDCLQPSGQRSLRCPLHHGYGRSQGQVRGWRLPSLHT